MHLFCLHTEGVVSNACKNIEAVIEEHFKSELEKIPYFHSWRGIGRST